MTQPDFDATAGRAERPLKDDLEKLSHDVRMDGVAFWRVHESVPWRKRLDPGAFVYFLAVISGRLTLRVQFPEQEVIHLGPGDAVSLSGMSQHLFEAGRPGTAEPTGRFELLDFAVGRSRDADVDLMIGVAPHEAMALANMINGPLPILKARDAEYSRHIWKAFEFLEDEFREREMHFDRDQIVRRMAEIMSININRAISHRGDRGVRNFTARRSKAYHRNMRGIWRSLAQFLLRPFDDWSVARLARSAGMSRTAYCESFRLVTGMTPKKSISRIRLALIARKLTADNLPLDAAADLAGYNSTAAFIRAFRREFRETPARWRAAQRP
ncbi:MAG: helix-turn-helix transcriptional regulator [Proteobacteria bacterium]|nr:helix-turn-helix transcriptional regulator [Pseudomonadota bacterium]